MGPKKKRLYLSNDRIIGGVCGGIAEYLDIDPVIVRLAWLLFTVTNKIGIVAYIAALFIFPAEPEGTPEPGMVVDRVQDSLGRFISPSEYGWEDNKVNLRSIGIISVIIGLIILCSMLLPLFSWEIIWAVAFIAIGLWLIFKRS